MDVIANPHAQLLFMFIALFGDYWGLFDIFPTPVAFCVKRVRLHEEHHIVFGGGASNDAGTEIHRADRRAMISEGAPS